jgi:uncharacterized protein (DUF433 family)
MSIAMAQATIAELRERVAEIVHDIAYVGPESRRRLVAEYDQLLERIEDAQDHIDEECDRQRKGDV